MFVLQSETLYTSIHKPGEKSFPKKVSVAMVCVSCHRIPKWTVKAEEKELYPLFYTTWINIR